DGTIISLIDITCVRLMPEEFRDDSGEIDVNTWELLVYTSKGVYTIFSAEGYDNPSEYFYSMDAVKGRNYQIAHQKYKKLSGAVEEEKEGLEFITL
ncbi:hypothetical protein LCGC14_2740610, partial [marine sediment metagenome]